MTVAVAIAVTVAISQKHSVMIVTWSRLSQYEFFFGYTGRIGHILAVLAISWSYQPFIGCIGHPIAYQDFTYQ